MVRNGDNPKIRWLLWLSAVIAVSGGVVLGIDRGALDLSWTQALHDWMQQPRYASLVAFLEWLSDPHGGQLPSILLISGSALFWVSRLYRMRHTAPGPDSHRRRKNAELIVLASVLVALLSPALKGTFARERPRYEKANIDYTPWYDAVTRNRDNPFKRGSFPSGHTLQATLLFGVAYWAGTRRRNNACARLLTTGAAIASFLYVALMAFSRVVLAKHWLADVFFSCLLGFWIVTFSAWVVFRKLDDGEALPAVVCRRWRRPHSMAATDLTP